MPSGSEKLKFISLIQGQPDWSVDSTNSWGGKSYADQTAGLLSHKSQPRDNQKSRPEVHGKHKEDISLTNCLLKDREQLLRDSRIQTSLLAHPYQTGFAGSRFRYHIESQYQAIGKQSTVWSRPQQMAPTSGLRCINNRLFHAKLAGENNRPFVTSTLPSVVPDKDEQDEVLPARPLATSMPCPSDPEKHKEDKAIVNRLLKAKGRGPANWKGALFLLEKYYKAQPVGDLAQPRALVRKVSIKSKPPKYVPLKAARDIPQPSEWSVESFARHVEDLTESQANIEKEMKGKKSSVSRSLSIQANRQSNLADVMTALEHMLYSIELQRYMTVQACNTALRFFCKHNMASKARDLYQRLKDLHIPIPTETFNITLRRSASDKDLYSFIFLLYTMIQRGIRPNQETWALFVMALESGTRRAVVVYKMREKGIMDSISIRRDIAALMIPHELIHYRGIENYTSTFLDHMDSAYGAGWMSTSAGNELLHQAERHNLDSFELIPGMKERGFMRDEVSLNIILQQCHRS